VLLAIVLCVELSVPLASGSAQEVKYWREDVAVTPAPELARFNDLLADLAEKLKPALVYVRVRRGAPGGRDTDDMGERGSFICHARGRGGSRSSGRTCCLGRMVCVREESSVRFRHVL